MEVLVVLVVAAEVAAEAEAALLVLVIVVGVVLEVVFQIVVVQMVVRVAPQTILRVALAVGVLQPVTRTTGVVVLLRAGMDLRQMTVETLVRVVVNVAQIGVHVLLLRSPEPVPITVVLVQPRRLAQAQSQEPSLMQQTSQTVHKWELQPRFLVV